MPPGNPDYTSDAAFRADAALILEALHSAHTTRRFDDPQVSEAVAHCARRARSAGCPPERLIVALKALVREVALPDMGDWYRAVITDRVVVWAVEAFYEIARDSGTGGARSAGRDQSSSSSA
jgi:hypothetical protein